MPIPPAATASQQLDVPFVRQEVAYCGPAALSSALQFYGKEASLESLVKQVYVPGRGGSLTLEMTAASRRNGLLPYPIEPGLDALLAELDAGHPVLVLQNLVFNWWPQWHYALVVGYTEHGRSLLLHSGDIPFYEINARTFARTWARSDFWGLVLVPPTDIPATAEVIKYLEVLEQMRETNALGSRSFSAALEQAALRWPDSSVSQSALANALLAAGEYRKASAAFIRSLQLRPDSALAWNNLAYALKAQSCLAEAYGAIQRARALAPNDPRVKASLADFDKNDERRAGCPALPL